jgi:hypothetical protein
MNLDAAGQDVEGACEFLSASGRRIQLGPPRRIALVQHEGGGVGLASRDLVGAEAKPDEVLLRVLPGIEKRRALPGDGSHAPAMFRDHCLGALNFVTNSGRSAQWPKPPLFACKPMSSAGTDP